MHVENMHYAIFPIIAMILVASYVHVSPYVTVIVSFVKGRYDPAIVQAAGGSVEELQDLGMLIAIIPQSQIRRLEHDPAIEFVETNSRFEIAVESTSIEYADSWGIRDIGIEPAHSLNYTGKGVKIGILDTGIDYTHPELATNYKDGYDFINNDNNPMDDNGHGTHIAGIIAAARDGNGIVGIAPDAEIYAVKVSDKNGEGSFSSLVKGINWSVEHDMDIVSISLTGEGGSKTLQKAIETAYNEHNITLVAAVGNGKGDVLYPAAYEQVIGVGSVRENNTLSSFSRTGNEVEFVAPGSEIKSAAIGEGYRLLSGTSMATPFVTGTIALILQSDERTWSNTGAVDGDGKWTNGEIRQVLRGAARDLGEKGRDNLYGYGLLIMKIPEQHEQPQISNSSVIFVGAEPSREGHSWNATITFS
jgi:subtilisin family serine protease